MSLIGQHNGEDLNPNSNKKSDSWQYITMTMISRGVSKTGPENRAEKRG